MTTVSEVGKAVTKPIRLIVGLPSVTINLSIDQNHAIVGQREETTGSYISLFHAHPLFCG